MKNQGIICCFGSILISIVFSGCAIQSVIIGSEHIGENTKIHSIERYGFNNAGDIAITVITKYPKSVNILIPVDNTETLIRVRTRGLLNYHPERPEKLCELSVNNKMLDSEWKTTADYMRSPGFKSTTDPIGQALTYSMK